MNVQRANKSAKDKRKKPSTCDNSTDVEELYSSNRVPDHAYGQLQHQCLLCAYNTRNRKRMRQHVGDVHKTNERVNCNLCGGSYKNVHSLKSHQSICRRKNGNQDNPLSLLKPVKSVNEEKASGDGDAEVGEQRDAYISDSDPKTIKKENVRGDGDAEDGGQIYSDSDPLSLLKSIKQQTINEDAYEEDDTAPVEGEYKVCDAHQDADGLGFYVEDAYGLD